ncbi:hypothetical protein QEV59_00065 [Trueperella pyogenes]|uniref:hypothetical protein n=1 Tax=Trueperella pyogenes TaxID=1661 RepID=UPI003132E347
MNAGARAEVEDGLPRFVGRERRECAGRTPDSHDEVFCVPGTLERSRRGRRSTQYRRRYVRLPQW